MNFYSQILSEADDKKFRVLGGGKAPKTQDNEALQYSQGPVPENLRVKRIKVNDGGTQGFEDLAEAYTIYFNDGGVMYGSHNMPGGYTGGSPKIVPKLYKNQDYVNAILFDEVNDKNPEAVKDLGVSGHMRGQYPPSEKSGMSKEDIKEWAEAMGMSSFGANVSGVSQPELESDDYVSNKVYYIVHKDGKRDGPFSNLSYAPKYAQELVDAYLSGDSAQYEGLTDYYGMSISEEDERAQYSASEIRDEDLVSDIKKAITSGAKDPQKIKDYLLSLEKGIGELSAKYTTSKGKDGGPGATGYETHQAGSSQKYGSIPDERLDSIIDKTFRSFTGVKTPEPEPIGEYDFYPDDSSFGEVSLEEPRIEGQEAIKPSREYTQSLGIPDLADEAPETFSSEDEAMEWLSNEAKVANEKIRRHNGRLKAKSAETAKNLPEGKKMKRPKYVKNVRDDQGILGLAFDIINSGHKIDLYLIKDVIPQRAYEKLDAALTVVQNSLAPKEKPEEKKSRYEDDGLDFSSLGNMKMDFKMGPDDTILSTEEPEEEPEEETGSSIYQDIISRQPSIEELSEISMDMEEEKKILPEEGAKISKFFSTKFPSTNPEDQVLDAKYRYLSTIEGDRDSRKAGISADQEVERHNHVLDRMKELTKMNINEETVNQPEKNEKEKYLLERLPYEYLESFGRIVGDRFEGLSEDIVAEITQEYERWLVKYYTEISGLEPVDSKYGRNIDEEILVDDIPENLQPNSRELRALAKAGINLNNLDRLSRKAVDAINKNVVSVDRSELMDALRGKMDNETDPESEIEDNTAEMGSSEDEYFGDSDSFEHTVVDPEDESTAEPNKSYFDVSGVKVSHDAITPEDIKDIDWTNATEIPQDWVEEHETDPYGGVDSLLTLAEKEFARQNYGYEFSKMSKKYKDYDEEDIRDMVLSKLISDFEDLKGGGVNPDTLSKSSSLTESVKKKGKLFCEGPLRTKVLKELLRHDAYKESRSICSILAESHMRCSHIISEIKKAS